jgi:hypothetical protein
MNYFLSFAAFFTACMPSVAFSMEREWQQFTFTEPTLTNMLTGLNYMVNLAPKITDPQNNGCLKIYQEMLTKAQDKGIEKLVNKNKTGRGIFAEIMCTTEKNSSVDAAFKAAQEDPANLDNWETFGKTTLDLMVNELKKRGIQYPTQLPDNVGFINMNAELDPKEKYPLIKAAVLLLYAPEQIQYNYTPKNNTGQK